MYQIVRIATRELTRRIELKKYDLIGRLNKCIEILKDKSLVPVMNNKIEGVIVHVVTMLKDIKKNLEFYENIEE